MTKFDEKKKVEEENTTKEDLLTMIEIMKVDNHNDVKAVLRAIVRFN